MIRKSIVTVLSSAAIVFAVAMFAFAAPPQGGPAAGSGGGEKKADTMSLVGKPAPAFEAETLDGKKVSLAGEKGNVVLMDFWASWCPPCKASLPHIQELANDKELAAKGFKVWAVDTNWRGETKEKGEKFVKDNNYTFTVPYDKDNAATKGFLAHAIPTTVLVGRDGTIKQVWIGYDENGGEAMKKVINDALNEPAPSKPA
jgi:thiol-disulfide isomerase/thioredoxin